MKLCIRIGIHIWYFELTLECSYTSIRVVFHFVAYENWPPNRIHHNTIILSGTTFANVFSTCRSCSGIATMLKCRSKNIGNFVVHCTVVYDFHSMSKFDKGSPRSYTVQTLATSLQLLYALNTFYVNLLRIAWTCVYNERYMYNIIWHLRHAFRMKIRETKKYTDRPNEWQINIVPCSCFNHAHYIHECICWINKTKSYWIDSNNESSNI